MGPACVSDKEKVAASAILSMIDQIMEEEAIQQSKELTALFKKRTITTAGSGTVVAPPRWMLAAATEN